MKRLGPLALVLIAPFLSPTSATAAPIQHSIPLPLDFQPEGIAVGTGSTFYAGSLWDGDVYRGDLRSGKGSVFIDVSGRQATGMKVDEASHRLFVAGGFTGHAYVYDTRDGSTLADFTLSQPGSTLVNDVVVTRRAAYFTDSFAPLLYKVPIGKNGSFGTPTTITVTGPGGVVVPGGFGLNGIDATPNGKVLIADHSALGALVTIDPATGVSRSIDLTGGSLVPGTVDGILLHGRTVWVVENFANALAEVSLVPDLSTGRVVKTMTDSAFHVPTAVAAHGGRLALLNARFDLGFPPPLGPGAPSGTDFDVILVSRN